MSKLTKKTSAKKGLPPGTLVHVGEKKVETVRITVMDYDTESFQEKTLSAIEECFQFRTTPTATWINVDGIHEVEIIEKLGKEFGIHPLVLEDVLNTNQRPKVEDYGQYIFVVLRMISYDEQSQAIKSEQVSLVLGTDFLISFQEVVGDVFDEIRQRIRQDKGRIRKMPIDYLAYCLTDAVVDNYFSILEKLGDRIESLQERLVSQPNEQIIQHIYETKRELALVRRSVWPLREAIGGLQRTESPLIKEATGIYLRDIHDHTIQVIDTVESLRDMVAGMVDIYLSTLSNRMNAVMKVLTIIATIFIPLTFIAGIYGMNFQYMPELQWPWAYPATLLLMAAVAVTMLFYFRRKRWL